MWQVKNIYKKIISKDWQQILIIFLIWRVFLLFIAFLAPKILIYKPSFPYWDTLLVNSNLPAWLYSWGNFDGVHYLTIIKQGYFGTGLIQAFFPGFPILVRLINIFNTPLVSSLIISNLFAYFGLLMLYKLLKLDYDKKLTNLIILTFLLFPSSFFMGAIYSESLFLFFIFTSFYFARTKNWLWAGILGALASSTRLVGIFIVPALLVEYWQQNKKREINFKKIFYIFMASLGLLSYMLYLTYEFSDPLYFFHVQAEFGGGRQESLILLPQVFYRYLKIILTNKIFSLATYAIYQEFILSSLASFILILSYKKIRLSYWLFSLSCFILPTLTGTFSSMPRYLLSSFVIFILIAKLILKNKFLKFSYFTLSFILLIFNTVLFINGYWVS